MSFRNPSSRSHSNSWIRRTSFRHGGILFLVVLVGHNAFLYSRVMILQYNYGCVETDTSLRISGNNNDSSIARAPSTEIDAPSSRYSNPVYTKVDRNMHISRLVVCYLSSTQMQQYIPQLRWLLKSWEWMQEYESNLITTDVLVVTDNITTEMIEAIPDYCEVFDNVTTVAARRMLPILASGVEGDSFIEKNSKKRPGRFLLVGEYVPLRDRFSEFKTHDYADSVGVLEYIAPMLQAYDLVLRSDMDCFLTPAMASFIPKLFTVGRGGYGSAFAIRRLHRIQRDMNLSVDKPIVADIGSSWYGDSHQMVECAKLTIEVMRYLHNWEFTTYERGHGQSWPEWHYGVLSLYGGHIAINYCLRDEGFEKLPEMLDFPSTSDATVWDHAHIHVWHTHDIFSKFAFASGKYKDTNVSTLNKTIVREYALAAAVEANYFNGRLIPIRQIVSCGNHNAKTCGGCPQGNGEAWCHGDCEWNNVTNVCTPPAKRS